MFSVCVCVCFFQCFSFVHVFPEWNCFSVYLIAVNVFLFLEFWPGFDQGLAQFGAIWLHLVPFGPV